MPTATNYDHVQARLGPDLFELYQAFRDSTGLSSSEALRVLISRGLFREGGGAAGDVDEAAFMSAYYNASAAFVSEMRRVLTGTPINDLMRAIGRTVAARLGVRFET